MTEEKKSSEKKIAVLMGGWTSEREVSLTSGGAVCKALEELGHTVIAVDVQRDINGILQALTLGAEGRPDVIFNALHGRGGEDGTIQGLLDFIGIPYTHSGVLASAVAMDKPLMRTIAIQSGIRCADGFITSHKEINNNGYPMKPPFVIKPTNEGSSVGVRVVKTDEDIEQIEEDGWIYGEEVLIEAFIPGKELTVSVLGDETGVKPLMVTELRPLHQDFYDYTAKYSDGQTEHLLPAPIPDEIANELMSLSVLAYQTIGCQGAARADFRWDDTKKGTEGIHFLEINTQPGLTPFSLLPEQANHTGMDFNELITWMINHPTVPLT